MFVVVGLVTPLVIQSVLGATGSYLLLTVLSMALMSTGSGEVMAVASIVIYDIYKVYVRPFR
jgi:Na+/proline symporter